MEKHVTHESTSQHRHADQGQLALFFARSAGYEGSEGFVGFVGEASDAKADKPKPADVRRTKRGRVIGGEPIQELELPLALDSAVCETGATTNENSASTNDLAFEGLSARLESQGAGRVPDSQPARSVQPSAYHLRIARKLSRQIGRAADRSTEQERMGRLVCRHLIAMLKDD